MRRPDAFQSTVGCIVMLIFVKLALFVGLCWVAWHFIAKYW